VRTPRNSAIDLFSGLQTIFRRMFAGIRWPFEAWRITVLESHGSIGTYPAVLPTSMTSELNMPKNPNIADRIENHSSSPDLPSGDARLLDVMVEGASEGLVLLSADSLVLHANRAAVGVIGGDRNAIIGRSIHEVFFKGAFDALPDVLTANLVVTRTHELPDGRSILVVARPVVAGAARVLLTLCDISSMKQLMDRARGARRVPNRTWAEMRGTEATATDGAPIITRSVVMQHVRDRALQCAAVDSPVLLLGETGTGKGVFAKLIHDASARRSGPFYVVNCGAIPEGLLKPSCSAIPKGPLTVPTPAAR